MAKKTKKTEVKETPEKVVKEVKVEEVAVDEAVTEEAIVIDGRFSARKDKKGYSLISPTGQVLESGLSECVANDKANRTNLVKGIK